eukprot:COSAG01_NODE_16616_length_1220_cov_2.443354_2_plen_60_part_00
MPDAADATAALMHEQKGARAPPAQPPLLRRDTTGRCKSWYARTGIDGVASQADAASGYY